MAVGTGADNHWIVTVGGQASAASVASISYAQPYIMALATLSPLTLGNLGTAGWQSVHLSGVNFGDVGSSATAQYSQSNLIVAFRVCVCMCRVPGRHRLGRRRQGVRSVV